MDTPRTSDGILVDLSDGDFTGREPHTSHPINELSFLLPTQETTGRAVGTEMEFDE